MWLAVALLLPYYGAEAYGLNELGRYATEHGDAGVLDVADAFRYAPFEMTTFALGLFAAGARRRPAGARPVALRSARSHRGASSPASAWRRTSRSSSVRRRSGSRTASCSGSGLVLMAVAALRTADPVPAADEAVSPRSGIRIQSAM